MNIASPITYVAVAVSGSLVVRIASSLLKALDTYESTGRFHERFWRAFSGVTNQPHDKDDYWHPFVLGTLELVAFPPLLVVGLWEPVGAWFAIKALPQWQLWSKRRSPFNRFLICNLLVAILAVLAMAPLVTVEALPTGAERVPPNKALQRTGE